MASQADKYNKAMAGEFFVAAQLQRLGAAASVTYGNAKRADVIAIGKESGKAVLVEVKTSSAGRWPVGRVVPPPSQQPWVFVHLPEKSTEPPEFFILTQAELHAALAPKEQAYLERYKQRHGEEYGDKPGVAAANRKDLEPFINEWETIMALL